MQLIIIDGSSPRDPCYKYVQSLASDVTTVGQYGYNIGHGRGMDAGLQMVKTRYTLVFDTDIEMLKSPLAKMLAMFDEDTYGVGYLELTAMDGFEYGAKPEHRGTEPMRMLHPYFMMLQTKRYFDFHPFVHHGAPCFKAARDIHRRGLTSKIIKEFPGLGHTSGRGWNWTAIEPEWVRHDTAGTRQLRIKRGLRDIEGRWEY